MSKRYSQGVLLVASLALFTGCHKEETAPSVKEKADQEATKPVKPATVNADGTVTAPPPSPYKPR